MFKKLNLKKLGGKRLVLEAAKKNFNKKTKSFVVIPAKTKVNKITLSKAKLTLNIYESKTLTAKVNPVNMVNFLKWKSSAPGIAAVTANGKVTAEDGGTAVITAYIGAEKVKCKVTVKKKTTDEQQGAEIIKVYKHEMGPVRFIGKKFSDNYPMFANFGKLWDDFSAKGWFSILESLTENPKNTCEDGDATIGLMRYKDGEPFEYWVGMFLPPNTPVPEGFVYIDFEASNIGVSWIYGEESKVFDKEGDGWGAIENEYEIATDKNGAYWFFERYANPRFSTPDEKGNIILDYCHFVK